MPVYTPGKTNFLYRFELGNGRTYPYTNIAEEQLVDVDEYVPIQIEHSAPSFSDDPQDAEVDLTIYENNPIADLYVVSPPPYPVVVKILEYDRESDIAVPYYKGWIVRAPFELQSSLVSFHLKSVFHFFERESFSDSLAALSRYSIYDQRSEVDIESLRTTITIDAMDPWREVLTVSGIVQPDDWFKGGMIRSPDGDLRSILEHKTVLGNKQLTLNGAFSQQSLDIGFTADIFPGDDLTFDTWRIKYGAQTHDGMDFGGWPFMPDVDPAKRGLF